MEIFKSSYRSWEIEGFEDEFSIKKNNQLICLIKTDELRTRSQIYLRYKLFVPGNDPKEKLILTTLDVDRLFNIARQIICNN